MGKKLKKEKGNTRKDNRLVIALTLIIAFILLIFLGPLGWQKMRYDATRKYVNSLQKVEDLPEFIKASQFGNSYDSPFISVDHDILYSNLTTYSPVQPCQKISITPTSTDLANVDTLFYYDHAWNIFWIVDRKSENTKYYGPFKNIGEEKKVLHKENLRFTDFWGETVKKTAPLISKRIPCDLW